MENVFNDFVKSEAIHYVGEEISSYSGAYENLVIKVSLLCDYRF